jgi:uroporphyrinogen-III synthase
MTAHPLSGKRIVSTRAEEQSREFVTKLREVGAAPIIFPTIRIAPLDDFRELDGALRRLREYDWLVFTSVNGVRSVVERMQALGLSPTDLNACQVAAIGPATETLLRSYGVQTALRPGEYVAEAVAAGLVAHGPISGKRFLLLRVDIARPVLREHLIAHGAQVDEIATYQTTTGQPDAAAYAELRSGVDVITFTSSSTVRHFFDLLGDEALPIARRARIACIGPITAQTARERGLTVDVVAEQYTILGLIEALTDFYAEATNIVTDSRL